MNFWEEMRKKGGSILCLAPMADVTDAAFRFIIAKYSKQEKEFSKTFSSLCTDIFLLKNSSCSRQSRSQGTLGKVFENSFVTYTEFVSADGLILAPEAGRKKLLKNLEYSEIERPIVAQFFTSKPEMMEKAAALAVELGFDGVDINMGCPDKSIEKQGAGAALIKNPKLARELIVAAKQGIQNYNGRHCNSKRCGVIPVSVKTRLGYNKDELETWLPELLAENPAAIIIHARTRKEMSKVPARWERIKRAVEIRNEKQNFSPPQPQKCTDKILLNFSSCSAQSASQGISGIMATKNFEKTLIIGNGDVVDAKDAKRKCEETGADGAMLGRAIFGKPWLLSNSYEWFNEKNNPEVIRKILEILVEHTKFFEEKMKGFKNFALMKKHFKSYLAGIPESKELRDKLMQTENAEEVEKIIKDYLSKI